MDIFGDSYENMMKFLEYKRIPYSFNSIKYKNIIVSDYELPSVILKYYKHVLINKPINEILLFYYNLYNFENDTLIIQNSHQNINTHSIDEIDIMYNTFLNLKNINNYLKQFNTLKTLPFHYLFTPITYSSLPLHWIENQEKLKKLIPNQSILNHSLEDVLLLIKKKYPMFLNCYNNLEKIGKICQLDFGRYLLLYEYGGVYSDYDITYYRSINELVSMCTSTENFFLVIKENDFSMKGQVNNCLIIANKNNEFIFSLLNKIASIVDVEQTILMNFINKVLSTTGPTILTKLLIETIGDYEVKENEIFSRIKDNMTFYILPKCFTHLTKTLKPDSTLYIFVHNQESSWVDLKKNENYSYYSSYYY